MKRLIGVLLVILVPFLMAPRALADKPTIQRIPVDDEFVVEGQCAFPVDFHATGTLVDISYTDENGTVHDFQAFPQGTAILTNLDTGETLTVNISGPAFFAFNEDGSFTLKGTGSWLWFPNPQTGEPGMFGITGHFVFSGDAEGNTSWVLVGGVIVDLCAQLA